MDLKLNTRKVVRALLVLAVIHTFSGWVSANTDVEVGKTAASVVDAQGKPPQSPARILETGIDVYFNEQVSTNESGRVQLLFRDGTSLSVGANSDLTIDEYVYDPASDTGEMVLSVGKGIFRLVGGKISKNNEIIFKSASATVGIRGGIAYVKQNAAGLEAGLLFGTQMRVTSSTSGLTTRTSRPGRAISVSFDQPNAAPESAPIDPVSLSNDIGSLERAPDETEELITDGQADDGVSPSPEASDDDTAVAESDEVPASAASGEAEDDTAVAESDEVPASAASGDSAPSQEDDASDIVSSATSAAEEIDTDPAQSEEGTAIVVPENTAESGSSVDAPEDSVAPGLSSNIDAADPIDEGPSPDQGIEPIVATEQASDDAIPPGSSTPPAISDPSGTGLQETVLSNDPTASTDNLTPTAQSITNPVSAPEPLQTTGSIPTEQSGDLAQPIQPASPPIISSEPNLVFQPEALSPTINNPAPDIASNDPILSPVTPVGVGSPSPVNLRTNISDRTVALATNIKTFTPPITGPIGGTPAPPTVFAPKVTELAAAVDETTKTLGVRDETGEAITAPLSGEISTESFSYIEVAPPPAVDGEPVTTAVDEPVTTAVDEPVTITPSSIEDEPVTYCDPYVSDCSDADSPSISGYTYDSISESDSYTSPDSESYTSVCVDSSCDTYTGDTYSEAAGTKDSYPTYEEYDSTPRYETTSFCDERGCWETVTDTSTWESTTTFYPASAAGRTDRRASRPLSEVATTIFAGEEQWKFSSRITQTGSRLAMAKNPGPICSECRFLNWGRTAIQRVSPSSESSQITYWISGIRSAQKNLAAAAGQTARYSGNMVGAVNSVSQIREARGHFQADVAFSMKKYELTQFNASFDGRTFATRSMPTDHGSAFSIESASKAHHLNAQGYFFGSSAAGSPPPELGGNFSITGPGYGAAGVFAGTKD